MAEGDVRMRSLIDDLQGRIKGDRKRIVFIGDVMIDQWVHGHTAECQDGCKKFVQKRVVETPGGAANAERSVSNWDVNTSLYGQSSSNCPTKRRYMEDNKIIFRADRDDVTIREVYYEWTRKLALEMVKCAEGVLLSDYDKGMLTPGFIEEVSDLCAGNNIPCVADCKRKPEVYEGCILKGNNLWGTLHNPGSWIDSYVETQGGKSPSVWQDHNFSVVGNNLLSIECINHVGAGDCFGAHLALALAYGFSLKEAAAIAHSAGRVYVQYPHSRPPIPAEIASDLSTAT